LFPFLSAAGNASPQNKKTLLVSENGFLSSQAGRFRDTILMLFGYFIHNYINYYKQNYLLVNMPFAVFVT